MSGRILAVAALWFGPAFVIGHAETDSNPQAISVQEARELVCAYLAPTGCTKTKCEVLQLQDTYFPQLYFFEALFPNPTGSPHIGSWAVDPKTADLWDANICAEYSNRRVAKLQMQLRKRIGLTEAAYTKLKGRPPMCERDEKVEFRKN